jgi:hypothetical protein
LRGGGAWFFGCIGAGAKSERPGKGNRAEEGSGRHAR